MAKHGPNRKRFLSGIALGGAAAVAATPRALAQAPASAASPPPRAADAARAGTRERAAADAAAITVADPTSDFMVDVLKTLGVAYVAANAGSSFRGLHESIVNYGGNVKPEFITCTHEEVSVALAHGYAKAAGKPMLVLAHSNVGLQHASMAVYNAWADRVPVVIIAGNALDATKRRPGAEWYHSAVDLGATLHGIVKYSDQPVSAQHYAESLVRAYALATTPPMAPVLIGLDGDLQERPLGAERHALRVPAFHPTAPPAGDPNALAEAAKILATAQRPVIVADRAVRTQAGMDRLVELAETLGAAVLDLGSRLNVPTTHWANQTGANAAVIGSADALLFLEVDDVYGSMFAFSDAVERGDRRIAAPQARTITIGLDAGAASTNNQDAQRFFAADLPIAGDAERSLPGLIDAVRRELTASARAAVADRSAALRRDHATLRARDLAAARWGWDASPLSTARVTYELGEVLKHEDVTITGPVQFFSNWPLRLWPLTKAHNYLGRQGASGEGYAAPALIGAALALKGTGRIPVCIQNDGDLMYQPGSYWTAAHHRIPLLSVMHNNRAWHQEVMHVQRMANRRQRGIDRAHVGTTLADPEIDYAKLIGAMGVWTAGPIREPRDLRPALERALAAVKRGEPALVDVHTQPR